MKNCIILGGNIFAHEVAKILKKFSFNVILINRNKKKASKKISQIKIDKYDNFNFIKEAIIKKKPKLFINLVSANNEKIQELFKYNVYLPIKLYEIIDKFSKETKLILTGSAAEYGKSVFGRKSKESDILKPVNNYGLSKALQSLFFLSVKNEKIIQFNLIRIFNISGANTKYSIFYKINNFLKKKYKSKNFYLYNLDSFRDFIEIKKCAKIFGLISIFGKKNNIYNIGSGKYFKVEKFFEKELKKIKKKTNLIVKKKKLREINFSCANMKKTNQLIKSINVKKFI